MLSSHHCSLTTADPLGSSSTLGRSEAHSNRFVAQRGALKDYHQGVVLFVTKVTACAPYEEREIMRNVCFPSGRKKI